MFQNLVGFLSEKSKKPLDPLMLFFPSFFPFPLALTVLRNILQYTYPTKDDDDDYY